MIRARVKYQTKKAEIKTVSYICKTNSTEGAARRINTALRTKKDDFHRLREMNLKVVPDVVEC